MKKYLFILFCVISSLSILAQPGCPSVTVASPTVNLPCGTTCTTLSATYFNVGSTTTYDVTQIPYNPPVPYWSGTPVLIGIDDAYSNTISMPFNFCFFGQTYNQFIIGSNGVVSFDVSNAGGTNSYSISGPVPANTPSDCDASIMGVWEDIDPTNLGTTTYQVIGSYPCRTFVISYDSIPYYGDPNSVGSGITNTPHWASSEIVIYETTNVIEIYIREKQIVTGWNGGLAVEGIVNAATGGGFFPPPPTIAYTVPGRNATQWTANNDAWRFTPTSSSIVTVNWSHAGATLSTSVGDTAIGPQTLTYSVCPPSSTTVPVTTGYTVTAIYNRCDGTTVIESDSINVTTTPSPNGGPDQNLGCYASGLTATMAGLAFPGASWSALPGNPSATTIASTTSPTTTITGFGTTGTYTYLWGSGTCFDTVRLSITSGPTAEPTQFISCIPLPGGSVTLGASGTGSWAALPGNPGTAVITTPTNPTTTITTFSALGTYHFLWNNGTACTDSATVIVTNAPNINFSVVDIGCTNTTGSITATASGGVSPFTYQWSTGSTTDSIMSTTVGTYTVTVTDANHCSAIASDSISNLTGTVVIADSILNGCYGFNDGQIMLYMVPGGAYTYAWSTGGNTNPLTGLAAGNNYQVTVTNVASGCTAVGGPYTITTLGLDSLSITPLDTTVSLGDTIQLGSTVMGIYPATSYSWTPINGLSCSNCPNPILIPTISDTAWTAYQLTITYGSGCIATATDSIRAISVNLLCTPNAFSPNGDAKNNTFYIMATDVKDFRLAIYDRWGGEVFETNDINTGWDGTYKGNPEPAEVYSYFFSITYTNNKVAAREGTVTLFR